ncbi:ATP-binding protein [Alkalilimnicola ehrlichii]|uniref:ATP-binding protein n=1 Tax=Alkalilimnicola ehrlichii TaxID=351052 RepID=UPI003B9DD1DA
MRLRRLPLLHRVLWVAGASLLLLLGTTGLVVDHAFREGAEEARSQRLQGQIFGLLAAAELRDQALVLAGELPDARLRSAGSGLYAQVIDDGGTIRWRSPSLLDRTLPAPPRLAPGETQEGGVAPADGAPLHGLAYGIAWEEADGERGRFTLQVLEEQAVFAGELARFRQALWGWLAVAAGGLLLTQLLLLRWTLQPLRRIGRELQAVEAGRVRRLGEDHPPELSALTRRLNQLLAAQQQRMERHQQALGDLAHSLKTPLAVLRSQLPADGADTATAQLRRMDQAIDYHLRRAGHGPAPLGDRLPVRPVLERLLAALRKLDPGVRLRLDCPPDVRFAGGEAELMELAGNLLDNAVRHARSQVVVSAGQRDGEGLWLQVEDDGPGVPAAQVERILARGGRADERHPGQGIGLAVVSDLAAGRGGQVTVDCSDTLGGARFEVTLQH